MNRCDVLVGGSPCGAAAVELLGVGGLFLWACEAHVQVERERMMLRNEQALFITEPVPSADDSSP
ncbi:MAG TPA: hypothetical protein VEA38_11260 [Terriglobales bacterium]|nr:hypothetical protein [Terriglobales bacterium]